jgi:hypothetical protein
MTPRQFESPKQRIVLVDIATSIQPFCREERAAVYDSFAIGNPARSGLLGQKIGKSPAGAKTHVPVFVLKVCMDLWPKRAIIEA